MKHALIVVAALALPLSLAACGKKADEANHDMASMPEVAPAMEATAPAEPMQVTEAEVTATAGTEATTPVAPTAAEATTPAVPTAAEAMPVATDAPAVTTTP